MNYTNFFSKPACTKFLVYSVLILFCPNFTFFPILQIIVANPTTHSDQYLIDGLAENNSTIISEIYKRFSGKIYNWIKQNNGDGEIAQDIFQEAIIDIYRKAAAKEFILTCPFDAFLFAVVRNKWFNYLKINKKQAVTNLDDNLYNLSADVQQQSKQIMQYEWQFNLLRKKIEELQEGCREVLRLSWSGFCMEDVAEKLGVTYAYVRKKKSLCMAKLIESVKNTEEYNQLTFIK
jgi:RNA polymerase sigma factor (sigma-70 family)